MSKYKWLSLFFFILVVLLSLAAYAQDSKTRFPVFDATLYKEKPDLSLHGLIPLRIIYTGELWNKGENKDEPNREKIIEIAKTLQPHSIVCIDIEHWPVVGNPDEVKKSIIKYKTVASLIKEINPTVKIGFYGVLPVRDYWRANGAKGKDKFEEWLLENKALQPIAEVIDVVFPSLYTFYSDKEGWEVYAIENLKEAKKYSKPVYPFLWPMYHESNFLLKEQYISGDFWHLQLNISRDYADGVIIWGGWQEEWNEHAAWWTETKKFRGSLDKSGP
ncbi:MAG: hypothetical protein AB1805_09825 [Nitrospirota bacterium]